MAPNYVFLANNDNKITESLRSHLNVIRAPADAAGAKQEIEPLPAKLNSVQVERPDKTVEMLNQNLSTSINSDAKNYFAK